jgi:hypothetical protein
MKKYDFMFKVREKKNQKSKVKIYLMYFCVLLISSKYVLCCKVLYLLCKINMHNTPKCEACLSNRMVISILIMININYNSLIIINIYMNECV